MINPTTAERHKSQFQNLLADFVLGRLGPAGNIFVKVTLEIVDVRTHRPVLTMSEGVETAPGVVELINADLDRLDAAAFANEWGITPDA